MSSVGNTSGYVTYGAYFHSPEGQFKASIYLQFSVPVKLEVWNDTTDQLVSQRSLPSTTSKKRVNWVFDNDSYVHAFDYRGYGLFKVDSVPTNLNDVLEIRVWAPIHSKITIFNENLLLQR
ncbi:hypothetical protein [Sulfoacidibacillus ferrooxidans]|nr:hypothetical protein [Sulfoacidibacillus ferrooxidans]